MSMDNDQFMTVVGKMDEILLLLEEALEIILESVGSDASD